MANNFSVPGEGRREFPLKVTQRNQIFEILTEAGVEVEEFEWEWCENASSMAWYQRLLHRPSQSFFEVDGTGLGFRLRYSPGVDKRIESCSCAHWTTLRTEGHAPQFGVESVLKLWAEELATELRENDLWHQVREFRRSLESPPNFGSDPHQGSFSAEELNSVQTWLRSIDSSVRSLADQGRITARDLKVIQGDISRLRASADKPDRRGWVQTLVGTLLGWVLSEYVSRDQMLTWFTALNVGIGRHLS